MISLVLFQCLGFAYSQGDSVRFLTSNERKAREAEMRGEYNFGVITKSVELPADANTVIPALPKGLTLKIVSFVYDKIQNPYIGYISINNREFTFSIPTDSATVYLKGSVEWGEVAKQHESVVVAMKQLIAQQSQQQQRASPLPSSGDMDLRDLPASPFKCPYNAADKRRLWNEKIQELRRAGLLVPTVRQVIDFIVARACRVW